MNGGMRMRFRDFHLNIKIRIIESLLSSSASNMIYPFMTIYFANALGVGIAGIILSVSIIFGMISSFIGGYYSDRFGRKKIWATAESIKFVSIVTMTLVNGPLNHSIEVSAYITMCMMILNSLCAGFSGPAATAMLIDVSSPENRKYMYSIIYWANNISIAVGAILGGLLFENYFFELLLAFSVLVAISTLLIIFFIKESYVPSSSEERIEKTSLKSISKSYLRVFKDKLFIHSTLALLLLVSLEFQLMNYIAVKLYDIDGKSQNIPFVDMKIEGASMLGILRAENTIIVIFFVFIANYFIKKYMDKHVLIMGLIIYSLGYLIISYSENLIILVCAMFFASIGELLYTPVHNNYLASMIPDSSRSTYLAINDLVTRGALLISYLCVSISSILDSWMMTSMFCVFAVIGLGVFIKLLPLMEEKRLDSLKNSA